MKEKNLRDQSENAYGGLLKKLAADCKSCSGLCCVALYCAKTDGFPSDKEAGIPCPNLTRDFRCAVHSDLLSCRFKGCTAYDCFGAGQKVTGLYPGADWRSNPEKAEEIFHVFLKVFQLHQLLWYLTEAYEIAPGARIRGEIAELILQNETMTSWTSDKIAAYDIDDYRARSARALKKTTGLLAVSPEGRSRDRNFAGRSFNGGNLEGRDFSMSILIGADLEGCRLRGANFLGADLRDANIKNADLSGALFLTQMQINAARGNRNTKLPRRLSRPPAWQPD